jgi:hypothetical protein
MTAHIHRLLVHAGGTVARAKRTDRAEARRRYRASQGDEPLFADDAAEDDASAETTTATATTPSRPSGRERVRAAATPPAPPARPGMRAAFSKAFRPVDLRGDFAALPMLLRNRAFFIPLALIAGVALVVVLTGGTEPISNTLSVYFLAPPPVAPVFLAGFLAPRASWLIGGLLGAFAALVIVIILSVPSMQALTTSTTGASVLDPGIVGYSFFLSIIGGAMFAAVAAWYKRFLFLANPARAQRAANRSNSQQRKRGSESRPALARRR